MTCWSSVIVPFRLVSGWLEQISIFGKVFVICIIIFNHFLWRFPAYPDKIVEESTKIENSNQ